MSRNGGSDILVAAVATGSSLSIGLGAVLRAPSVRDSIANKITYPAIEYVNQSVIKPVWYGVVKSTEIPRKYVSQSINKAVVFIQVDVILRISEDYPNSLYDIPKCYKPKKNPENNRKDGTGGFVSQHKMPAFSSRSSQDISQNCKDIYRAILSAVKTERPNTLPKPEKDGTSSTLSKTNGNYPKSLLLIPKCKYQKNNQVYISKECKDIYDASFAVKKERLKTSPKQEEIDNILEGLNTSSPAVKTERPNTLPKPEKDGTSSTLSKTNGNYPKSLFLIPECKHQENNHVDISKECKDIYYASLLAVKTERFKTNNQTSQEKLMQVSHQAAENKRQELLTFGSVVATGTTVAIAEAAVADSAN